MSSMDEIKKLLKMREDLLNERPELQKVQKELDAKLIGKNSPSERLEVISEMMSERLERLRDIAKKLNVDLDDKNKRTVH